MFKEVINDDVLSNENETEATKLDRKRRQQQKKEEFLRQLKSRKSDEVIPGNSSTKSEKTSPSLIPEGAVFTYNILIGIFSNLL